MIRFVYFDLGGTVVDYHRGPITDSEKDELGMNLMRDRLRELNFPISWETLNERFYEPWLRERFSRGKKDKRELDLEGLLGNTVEADSTIYPELIDLFHEPARQYAEAIEGIGDALSALQREGIGAGIISNTPIYGKCHDRTLEKLNLKKYLSPRIYSYDRGVRKPFEEIYCIACENAGYSYDEVMMVGDSYRADVAVPSAMGMEAVLYDPRGQYREAPCVRISCFSEIMNFIEKGKT